MKTPKLITDTVMVLEEEQSIRTDDLQRIRGKLSHYFSVYRDARNLIEEKKQELEEVKQFIKSKQ